jgi:dTDP-4-dehydrorhamnose reductase
MKPEIWGGIECRVGLRYFDQLERNGHAHRMSDLDRIADLGLKTIRYPILWERVQPDFPDQYSWTWSDERMERLRQLGIRPIIGLLHHGSGPRWTDLLDPEFPVKLAEFAHAVAARYPWVDAYTPVNEPLTTARFSALYGHWFPHRKDDTSFAFALVNQIEAVVRCMEKIRSIQPRAILIQTEDIGKAFSTPQVKYQADFENERRWVTFDMLHGRFTKDHPLWHFLSRSPEIMRKSEFVADHPCPPEIRGVNYYVTSERYLDENLDNYPAETHGSNGFHSYADVAAVRGRREGLSGLESILEEVWQRYQAPLALTECHLGCTREEQVRWLMDAWRTSETLVESGVDIRAITVWALLGAFDWSALVTSEKGDYEPGAFDVRGPAPRETAIALSVRSLVLTRDYKHPILHARGWWERSVQPLSAGLWNSPAGGGSPIVVLGGAGIVGTALEKICLSRGLRCRTLPRHAADVCEEDSIRQVLETCRPWAVINASGYTFADEAEFDAASCFAVNSDGPAMVAGLCGERGIQYVGFSNELVFDGTKIGPYIESDLTCPVTVLGQSKEQAERRILERNPEALLIRTSALFSPWSNSQFAADILRGENGMLVPDAKISPTYVPDLCHAVLDLIVDGERGIWHLTNEGSISWHDFARALCRKFDFIPLPRLEVVRCDNFPAVRPLNGTLRSQRGSRLPSLEKAIDRFHEAFLPLLQEELRSRLVTPY